jgi:hypothetical protein
VAAITYGSNVSFRHASQLAQYRKLLIGTPRADTQATTFYQGTMHLASGGSLIGEELKPLLTENDMKPLSIQERQSSGVTFPPIDRRGHPPCDGQHLGIHVHAYDRPGRPQVLLGEPGNDARTASDIDDAIA